MAVGTPKTVAQCEPQSIIRDRMIAALNIKGLVTCPDKINVESIQPVYDLSDPTKEYPGRTQLLDVDLTGLVFIQAPLVMGDLLPANTQQIRLNSYYAWIRTDIAGRVALVNAEVRVRLRFLYQGVTQEISYTAWQVAAAAGNLVNLICGSHINILGQAGWGEPTPNLSNFLHSSDIIYPCDNQTEIYFYIDTTAAGGFPMNTFLITNAIYSYK